MKTRLLYCAILGAALIAPIQAQTITGFGSGQYVVTYTDSLTVTQTGSTTHIQGVDSGSILVGSLITYQTLSSVPNQLGLTGTLAGINPGTGFEIILQDISYNQLIYSGNWSSFTTPDQMVALNLDTADSAFDGTVAYLSLITGGVDNNSLDFTFAKVDVIPEPSAFVLMGIGLYITSLALRRSTRRSQAIQIDNIR